MSERNLSWRRVERGRCAVCGHEHALDIEYRCFGCDHEVCALCLVTVRETHEGFCPACAPGGGESGAGGPDYPVRGEG